MARLEPEGRRAVVAKLVASMEERGQWAGETHIQKALYFLQSMLKVPSLYDFVLYKHGPYSFDLHDDLSKMRAHLIIDMEPRRPYGPSFRLGQLGAGTLERAEKDTNKYSQRIDFVVEHLGSMGVRTLERYATALYVKAEKKDSDAESLWKAIVDRKPHISEEDARAAVQWVKNLEEEAKRQKLFD